ncbi:MAG: murein biosynthesis integral membrane protein MurJ [Candidatus Doudnabacteria bacterium]
MFKFIDNLEAKFSLGRTTMIIAGLTIISRATGFLRDLLLASNLGASQNADIYFTSFRLPDLIYNLIILGTLSAAFLPVFTEYYIKDRNHAKQIASSVFNLAVGAMAFVALLLFIFAKPLTQLIAPGFDQEALSQTVTITRILLLSPIIFTASSVVSSTLLSLKKFIWVNTAPVLYNAGIIFGLFILYPKYQLVGLALGVIIGACLHILIQLPQLRSLGFWWQPIILWRSLAVKKILKLFVPRIFGLDISYVNLVIVSIVGSLLGTGAIAAFNYASNIQSVPLGVFALSTTIAVFPVLAESHAKQDYVAFLNNFKTAFVRIIYFVMPFSVLMLLLRAYIVRVLIGYGQCDWGCTINTFDTLGVLTVSLVAQSLISLLSRAFYARQNTKTPVMVSILAMIVNAIFSYWLSLALGVIGIALGFVIASVLQFGILVTLFHKELRYIPGLSKKYVKSFDYYIILTSTQIVFSATVMGFLSYLSLYLISPVIDNSTVIGILIQTSFACLVAFITYVYISSAMHIPEAVKIKSALSKTMKFFNVSGIEQNTQL